MKTIRYLKTLLVTCTHLSLLLFSTTGLAYQVLDEQQLDNVVAGSQLENGDSIATSIPFHYQGRHGRVEGEAIIKSVNNTAGSLIIRDGAQSHLNSLININAVNAPVEVLLNLNVIIESRIGSIKQNNIHPDLRW